MGNTCAKENNNNNNQNQNPPTKKRRSIYLYRGNSPISRVRVPKHTTTVNVHPSVRVISSGSFRYCASIQSIDVSPSLQTIESEAFNGCTNLNEIQIPNSVTKIGDRAFYKCSSLAVIDIDVSSSVITKIGEEVFLDCTSLKSIQLPASLKDIGKYAFYGCIQLETVSLHKLCVLKTINACTFGNCKSLVNVELPKTVKVLKQNAFYKCKALKSIDIPQETISIENDTFYGCASLTIVNIPAHVNNLNMSAFQHCTGLQYINIHQSVQFDSNGMYAFQGCTSILSIGLPSYINQIGTYAFKGCVSLISVYIPPSVSSISNGAFTDCISLSSITLPKSITIFGTTVFRNCQTLHRIFRQSSYYVPRDFNKFIEFLTNRFSDYPIHELCYHYPNNATMDEIREKIIYTQDESRQRSLSLRDLLTTNDGFDTNPLHVIACNPFSTIEAMIQVCKLFNSKQQRMILTKKMRTFNKNNNVKDDETFDPLQLYMKSRGISNLSLSQALTLGMPWLMIKHCIIPQLTVDEVGNGCEDQCGIIRVYPFVIAAKQKNCSLETVYNLALSSVEVLVMKKNH